MNLRRNFKLNSRQLSKFQDITDIMSGIYTRVVAVISTVGFLEGVAFYFGKLYRASLLSTILQKFFGGLLWIEICCY